ncbi:hypothetical protein [Planctomyces sp. SH-PL62]|uniref:hypothetical protein n=1 Tax=Planctomyces sp. SH-PL62 TaxID=1636152 RepID=UPI00078C030D|nr:hypothetical protein [Planctomyces sp. SH-PL62]AMV35833.1 hypothetical protein VT85_00215 [Planctomyces sp. SH-PL62]
MTRPGFTPTAVLAATVLLGLGAWAPTASAAAINPNGTTATAYYRLTADAGLPEPASDIAGPQVVALVSPAGGVVPPINAAGEQGSPLTILGDSHGFDADQLVVALKDSTNEAGTPEQLLGLVFFGQGLQPGGVLHFALSIDKALADNPPKLTSSTPGVSITAITQTDPTPDPGTGPDPVDPAPNVPEPVGLLLWSAAGGAIVFRTRSRARARRLQNASA